jgi:hypothetical protein
LLLDPDRANRMGQRGAAIMAKDWGWANYVEEISAVYTGAIG